MILGVKHFQISLMIKWLKSEDSQSDLEVWGKIQNTYHFGDLITWLVSEDTPVHQSLRQNMSTSTFWTDSISPTLRISLHIGSKLHSLQIVPSVSLSVQIPKHRWKHTPSYLMFESASCHCCMYYHCCSTIVLFSIVPVVYNLGLILAEDLTYSFRTSC